MLLRDLMKISSNGSDKATCSMERTPLKTLLNVLNLLMKIGVSHDKNGSLYVTIHLHRCPRDNT